jgi:hypothetical protein
MVSARSQLSLRTHSIADHLLLAGIFGGAHGGGSSWPPWCIGAPHVMLCDCALPDQPLLPPRAHGLLLTICTPTLQSCPPSAARLCCRPSRHIAAHQGAAAQPSSAGEMAGGENAAPGCVSNSSTSAGRRAPHAQGAAAVAEVCVVLVSQPCCIHACRQRSAPTPDGMGVPGFQIHRLPGSNSRL